MDFLNSGILYLLDLLNSGLHSYGLAILVLTVLIRLVLWPLNASQTKSMKAMQTIQPKLKAIQEEFKGDPARMQSELMKLYSENKFNPFGGCLPMLLQLPIFIALYGALMSPDFMIRAGNESFLFINKLHHTLTTNGGEALDKQFGIHSNDAFLASPEWKVKFKGLPTMETIKLKDLRMNDPAKVLSVEPKPLIPGEPVEFKLLKSDVSTSAAYLGKIESIQVPVTVQSSKELENIIFKAVPSSASETPVLKATPKAEATEATAKEAPKATTQPTEVTNALEADTTTFKATLPTQKAKFTLHWDVLVLILLYGAMSWGYQLSNQKLMGTPAAGNSQQAMMMKWMPLLFLVMMLIVPIPAGVMLYLLMTMVMMVVQNMVMQASEDKNGSAGKMSSVPAGKQTLSINPE